MNILIKLTSIVALIIAPHLNDGTGHNAGGHNTIIEEDVVVVEEVKEVELVSGEFELSNKTTEVTWMAKKVTGKHVGNVPVDGMIRLKENIAVSGEMTIDLSRISVTDITDAESRKDFIEHMQSPDFFDVAKFPTASMKIINCAKGPNNYAFKGELTIKGKTEVVQGYYLISNTAEGLKLQGSFSFDRTDYGMVFRSGSVVKDLGDKLIYDDVSIGFQVLL